MKQGWGKIPFEDSIVKVKYTTKIPSNDYLEQGLYPIVSQEEGLISGYWDNANDVFKVSTPVVIFGDHTRILKYVDFDFVLGADGVKILQPIKSIDAKFFKLYLESCKIPSLGYSRHYKLLKELHVPIPPREEQEKIVAELDCLSGVIEKKREQLKELDALAQSIFYEMFGDPITNEKRWEVKKLGEVCAFQQGVQVPIEEQLEEQQEGMNRFLRIVDFTQGNEKPRYVHINCEKHILKEGEIAIVRYGSPGFVCYGKYGVIANNLFKIIPLRNSLSYVYFIHWLKSDAFQSVVSANQYGAALQAIKFSTIKDIVTILPPLVLQQRFAEKIEAIEKQKELIKESIKETETLFNARMDYYFN